MAYKELYTASWMAGEPYNVTDKSLALSPSSLRFTVEPRGVREGSFVVSAFPAGELRGLVFSDSLHMHVIRAELSGSPDRISWRFDAGALEDGDEIEGSFGIVSNCGEYRLPFHVKVEASAPESGDVRPVSAGRSAASGLLSQAQRDWESAVQMFYRREFDASLTDEREKLLYRGLSAAPGNEQNVEEFLIAACGKTPVEYEPAVREMRTEVYEGGSRQTRQLRGMDADRIRFPLTVLRSGWGYTNLEVETSGDFLTPDHAVMEKTDFMGDRCEIPLCIDQSALHPGRNFGSVTLRSPYQEIRIPVQVTCRRQSPSDMRKKREAQRILVQAARHYEQLHLSFVRPPAEGDPRHREIDSGEWLRQGYELANRLRLLDRESPVPYLYSAQLMLMENRIHQAVLELESLRRRLAGAAPDEVLEMSYSQYEGESQVEYCYRLFLMALAYNDADEITPRVGKILRERYRRTNGDWRIAWMMIQLIPEYAKGTPSRWNFLKKQFMNGCRSPILYLEAFEMIAAEPSYLNLELDRRTGRYGGDAFERQVVWYAVRQGIMDPGIMRHVLARIDRRRDYSRSLYHMLCEAYESEALASLRVPILESICRMLIRGGKADPQYFVWFSRAVDRQCALAKLSDFYLQSMPEDYQGEIPASVMRDAAGGVSVSGDNRAYFYRYLYENKSKYSDMYARYTDEIRDYLEAQIADHRMTDNLAALYGYALGDPAVAPSNVGDLTKLSYLSHLRTTHLNMRWAVVVYGNSSGEKRFPVENGNCVLPVYGNDNCIFLEDGRHNRYAVTVPYTCDLMMRPVARPERVSAQEMEDLPFALEIAGTADDNFAVTPGTAQYCALLIRSERVAPAYRARLAHKLLLYYEESGERERMDALWEWVDLMELEPDERTEVLTLMQHNGQSTAAARWILAGGAEHLSAQLLGGICLAALEEAHSETAEGERHEAAAGSDRYGAAAGRGHLTDRQLSRLANEAFRRGFREENLARLIIREQDALTQDLELLRQMILETEDIRRAEEASAALEERMIRQTLFSGEVIDSAAAMLTRLKKREESGDDAVAELLVSGMAQYAHYAFAQWREMEAPMMALITALHTEGKALPPIIRLAYLKALSKRKDGFDEQEADTASQFMSSLIREDIFFPFYREFSGAGPGLRLYDRETMIEFHEPAGIRAAQGHVVIHCALERGKKQESFTSRDMKEMVPGFYVSSFYLFYGEQIHYFITDDPAEKNIVETGTIIADRGGKRPGRVRDDRFGCIDALSESVEAGDRERTLDMYSEYRQREYLIAALFEDF